MIILFLNYLVVCNFKELIVSVLCFILGIGCGQFVFNLLESNVMNFGYVFVLMFFVNGELRLLYFGNIFILQNLFEISFFIFEISFGLSEFGSVFNFLMSW